MHLVDRGQIRMQVVVAQHHRQVRRRGDVHRFRYRAEPGGPQHVRGGIAVDLADRPHAENAARGADNGLGGVHARAVPVAQRCLVVLGTGRRRPHGHHAGLHQPGDHHGDLVRGQPVRQVLHQAVHIARPVQQGGERRHDRAAQYPQAVLGEQVHAFAVGHLDAKMALEPHPRGWRIFGRVMGMPGDSRLHRTLPRLAWHPRFSQIIDQHRPT